VLRKEHILLLLCARHHVCRPVVSAVVATPRLDVCDRRAEGRVYANRDVTGRNGKTRVPARASRLACFACLKAECTWSEIRRAGER
jgi:hypothetical protein